MSDKKLWDEFIKVAKERDTLLAEITRLTAERDRALDRIAAMVREAERKEVSTAQALERRNLELHGEIKRLRAALDKLPGRITPDEEDGEPDYYADGWNDAIDAMMAIRERK